MSHPAFLWSRLNKPPPYQYKITTGLDIYIENREREVNNKNTEKNNKQEANIYKNKTYKSKKEKSHNERVDCGCVKECV